MRIKMIAPQVSDNATTANMTEIAPVLNDNILSVQDGENNRRSWGCVKITATVVIKTRTFATIHVGVAHKYGGTQGWFYYEQPAGEVPKRVTAAKLSPRRRKQVLAAYDAGKAPCWAKLPFSREPRKASKPERHTRYKKVAVCNGGELRSMYDGSEYSLGKTRRERVQSDHNGGFYVYRSAEVAEKQTAFPSDSEFLNAETIVVKCEVWGRSEWYGETEWVECDASEGSMKRVPTENTKEAWTYCRPVAVVE